MAIKRSPAKKSSPAKSKPRSLPTPLSTPLPQVDWLVDVAVDKKGNFTYKANNGINGETLRPNLGDTVSWSVRVNGKRKPFQIEFPGFSPFGFLTRIIRSSSKATKPLTVTIPKHYQGNLVMNYRVTVPGAWSDDPDIVPPSSDGVANDMSPQVISLGTDDSGQLTLTPENATLNPGGIAWQWAGTPQDDFELTFETPPAGWPKNTITSVNGVLVLSITAPSANQGYKIVTVHSNLHADGVLTIA
jgi:hypothetical protein